MLEERLGYRFEEIGHLELALKHRSWCAENDHCESNERLEFLGDAVLSLVVADRLYGREPRLAEGEMSKARATVVNAAALGEEANGVGLGMHLLLGKGEVTSGGRSKQSILADAFEAVIGAVYLDGGSERVQDFVLARLGERIDDAALEPGARDYKTLLQECLARLGLPAPKYDLRQAGPHHDRSFRVVVEVADEFSGTGEGTTKKQAEQRAARVAWEARCTEVSEDGEPDV